METLGVTKVAGVGSYLPAQSVKSDDLMAEVNARRFGIEENYMSSQIGIVERRVAEIGSKPSDLATLASESALNNSGVRADEIDLLIFAGITRDYDEPSTAHNVQKKLGAVNASCFDVTNACLGFMTALSVADAYIAGGMADTILVCTGETSSQTMEEFLPLLKYTKDKNEFKAKLGVLTIGDAGGAMIIQRDDSNEHGWNWKKIQSQGEHSELCYYTRGKTGVEGQMVMDRICAITIKRHMELFELTKKNLPWSVDEVDKIYCHQVGATPHKQLLSRTHLPIDKAPTSYQYFGNLASATIPVLMQLDAPKRSEKIMFFCSGSGISVFQGGMKF